MRVAVAERWSRRRDVRLGNRERNWRCTMRCFVDSRIPTTKRLISLVSKTSSGLTSIVFPLGKITSLFFFLKVVFYFDDKKNCLYKYMHICICIYLLCICASLSRSWIFSNGIPFLFFFFSSPFRMVWNFIRILICFFGWIMYHDLIWIHWWSLWI